jgi:hypothetical protein
LINQKVKKKLFSEEAEVSVHQESFTQKLTSIVDIIDNVVHIMKEMINSGKVSPDKAETKEATEELKSHFNSLFSLSDKREMNESKNHRESSTIKEIAKKLGILIAGSALIGCSMKMISHIKKPTISIRELLKIIILKIKLSLIYIKIFLTKKTQLLLEKN